MDTETELLKTVNKDELDASILEKIKAFHGLLTREAAMRLLAKEKGLLKEEERAYELAKIPEGTKKLRINALVKKVWPVATYSSGKRSRVLELEDSSGSRSLLLWNQDVELANNLRSRDRISIRGAYERNGELHLGFNGELKMVSRAGFLDLANIAGTTGTLTDTTNAHVRGFVFRVLGPGEYVRGGKSRRGSAFTIVVEDGGGVPVTCVVFENSDRVIRLRVGDEVIFEDAEVAGGLIWIGKGSRMFSRRKDEMLCGKLDSLSAVNDGSGMVVEIDGKSISLDRENALRLLGAAVADDISLPTVVTLKKQTLINRNIALKIEKKEDTIFIKNRIDT